MSARPRKGYAGARPSKSADAARLREIEHVRAMTPRERILLALRLRNRGKRLSALMTGAKRGG